MSHWGQYATSSEPQLLILLCIMV